MRKTITLAIFTILILSTITEAVSLNMPLSIKSGKEGLVFRSPIDETKMAPRYFEQSPKYMSGSFNTYGRSRWERNPATYTLSQYTVVMPTLNATRKSDTPETYDRFTNRFGYFKNYKPTIIHKNTMTVLATNKKQ